MRTIKQSASDTCNTLLLLSDNTREYNEYSRNRCYDFA